VHKRNNANYDFLSRDFNDGSNEPQISMSVLKRNNFLSDVQ